MTFFSLNARSYGNVTTFEAVVRFDSEVEIDYYRHGGILQMVLREKMKQS
ncbi:hypothetical protein MOD62_13675 [Bacillus spizizenii]|nr:hypothetical protein [Bacillus spizizenii]